MIIYIYCKPLDNHLRWLKEGYNDQDKDANLEFDTLFEFHIRKLGRAYRRPCRLLWSL